MIKNKEIEQGARVIAEDFKLPQGRRKKVARLIRDNWDWFDAAEARGLGEEDMLNTLTAAGATYDDGSPINFSTLANALWRRRNNKAVKTANEHKTPARTSRKRDESYGLQARSRGRTGRKSPKQTKQIAQDADIVTPAVKRRKPPSAEILIGAKGTSPGRMDKTRMSADKGSPKRGAAKEVRPSSATLRGELKRQEALRRLRSDNE
jgi:hypothetical protein